MTLLNQFLTVRKHSETLCSPLQTEDYVPQPVVFASPPKWHLAHTTWFFEEMILKHTVENYTIFHKEFSFLFNSYYQTIGERAIRIQRGVMTRPTVEKVYEYRKHVDQHMSKLLSSPITEEVKKLVILGLNHEQQHQELLLTDLKYTLSLNPIFPVYQSDFNLVKDTNTETGWLTIPEGVYSIGHASSDFCFDNELGIHKVYLHEYKIAKSLVTNGEFISFIEDGGYTKFQFWLDEGWSWVTENNIENPLYWYKIDGEWYHYTLSGLQKVDKNAILSHISFYESHAYAAWKGYRLATEFEWEVASKDLSWGKRWEWTNSAYLPYPNYTIAEGAVGEYNGKFMINQMVLRGASVATSKGHSRPTYRNFFHPHLQWQFTGIRLAQ
ncbi:hercynine oxygenase [Flavobacteriaceae bacterium UJ101]|nr:hercynine oxygenase [Flavobacteriaceae bacterium UJ101]